MENKIPKHSQLNNWPTQESFKQMVDENFEEEAGHLSLRFEDLSNSGQKKLCKLLKKCSPIWTVQKPEDAGGLTKGEIKNALRVANPIIFSNWRKGFCNGQLTREKATEISRVAYYMCRRKPSEEAVEKITKLVSTNWTFAYQVESYRQTLMNSTRLADLIRNGGEIGETEAVNRVEGSILTSAELAKRIRRIRSLTHNPAAVEITPPQYTPEELRTIQYRVEDDELDDQENINMSLE